MPLALEGIKVLDLSRVPTGSLCTMILGDLGAEVLKVEAPPGVGPREAGTGLPAFRLPGHDINYIAAAGVLDLIGEQGSKPVIPLNIIGDYGGGSLFAVIGILAALQATVFFSNPCRGRRAEKTER